MTEQELLARDAGRDIAAELLHAVRDLKAGRWARKTTFEVLADGTVRRRIERRSQPGPLAPHPVLAFPPGQSHQMP